MEKKDYSCEIIAVCVLTILSALSHFWYIMIAICAGLIVTGVVGMLSKVYLRLRMISVSDLYSPPPVRVAKPQAKGMLEAAQGSGQPLPAVEM